MNWQTMLVSFVLLDMPVSGSFSWLVCVPQPFGRLITIVGESTKTNRNICESIQRRKMFQVTAGVASLFIREPACAGSFTPGGTLVDREVGVRVSNPEASPSRKADNSNVLFNQDYYFKFGAAAQWIEPGSKSFPEKMPFTTSQQRYDALKKYGERVKRGVSVIKGLGYEIKSGVDLEEVPDPSGPEYSLRPMGLLANGFMASENTGTTNELLLARWYVNEIYLQLGDIRTAKNEQDALSSYEAVKKALNSYLSMLNRVITSKVGDKFEFIE